MNCKNCNSEVAQNYCPSCGLPVKLKRIDGHYIIHEIKHVLHFEKGILYTFRELLTNPGHNVRHFITEDRSRLVKPVIFIIITSLIYSITVHFFNVEDSYVKYLENKPSTISLVFKWIQSHYGYANIIMGVFIALWLKFFFRKETFNFFEILILLCFVMGMGMMIFTTFAIIQSLTGIGVMNYASIFSFIYSIWAIVQFFNKKKFTNYLKAFGAYLLGMITFMILAIALGLSIELFVKL